MPAKSADQWFDAYGASHQNRLNKAIHWICVPTITACVLALLWEAPTPAFIHGLPLLNWAALLIVLSLIFYLRLSPPLAMGMVIFMAAAFGAIVLYQRFGPTPVWQAALMLFVAAWVGQFIGHTVEGKKPSFFQDVQFLLIGPIWLLAAVYRKLNIRY